MKYFHNCYKAQPGSMGHRLLCKYWSEAELRCCSLATQYTPFAFHVSILISTLSELRKEPLITSISMQIQCLQGSHKSITWALHRPDRGKWNENAFDPSRSAFSSPVPEFGPVQRNKHQPLSLSLPSLFHFLSHPIVIQSWLKRVSP